MNEEQQREHAHHEAGHAVSCFIFHIPVTKISLPDKITERDTSLRFDPKNFCTDWKTKERFIGLIVNAYAGYFAALKIDSRATHNPGDEEYAVRYSNVCTWRYFIYSIPDRLYTPNRILEHDRCNKTTEIWCENRVSKRGENHIKKERL
jgi:hypothetical protein